MKKMLVAMFVCAMMLVAAEVSLATTISKTFVGKGSFQVFVPFCFTVPYGNSNSVITYEFQHGWPLYGIPSQWVLKSPGEQTYRGLYRFVSSESYSTLFKIEGELDSFVDMDIWQVVELEPEDMGMLTADSMDPGNVFRLPTDDLVASYFLLMPNPGMNITLGGILKGQDFIWMNGTLSGVIISDSRGFLKERISGKHLERNLDKILVRDTDVVILEYGGEY